MIYTVTDAKAHKGKSFGYLLFVNGVAFRMSHKLNLVKF